MTVKNKQKENRIRKLTIKGKEYAFPIFLPDATLGVVRSIDSLDMKACDVRGAVVNTYHLMSTPGTEVLKTAGGIKGFMNYDGLITSDSGGWQVFSLIHRNEKKGKITDKGVVFSFGGGKNKLFTPEMSIQTQFDIGSDIIICLDDFTSPKASRKENAGSVRRTTYWARRCKEEYLKQIEKRGMDEDTRPLLFAVIQGHRDKDLRRESAKGLIEIGFDGYGYGGYLVNDDGNLDLEMSQFIADLIPNDKVKFALGMGKPWEIAKLYDMGWDIFDCTLPTRDARHGRLYTFKKEPKNKKIAQDKKSYEYIAIERGKFKDDASPISEYCKCHTCKNYSRAYLHHLFKIKDTAAYRLATIHNLNHFNKVIDLLSS